MGSFYLCRWRTRGRENVKLSNLYRIYFTLFDILETEECFSMNIEIKKLTPDLAEDYARFFDVTP